LLNVSFYIWNIFLTCEFVKWIWNNTINALSNFHQPATSQFLSFIIFSMLYPLIPWSLYIPIDIYFSCQPIFDQFKKDIIYKIWYGWILLTEFLGVRSQFCSISKEDIKRRMLGGQHWLLYICTNLEPLHTLSEAKAARPFVPALICCYFQIPNIIHHLIIDFIIYLHKNFVEFYYR
jgi:hypothetical protein